MTTVLGDHLQNQSCQLDSLLDLLHEERRLLAAGQVDGTRLAQVAEAKREHLAALDTLEQQRRREVHRRGYSDDSRGDESAADAIGRLVQWRSVRARAARVAELNRGNGQLIGIRMEHNQRLLNTLRDAAGSNLYGPDGQAHGRTNRVNSRA